MNRLPCPTGLFRSPPGGERPAFFRDEKSRQKNPSAADAFMEKLRRGKACRDPNPIAAQAMAHFPPPCFSHKTLRGLFW